MHGKQYDIRPSNKSLRRSLIKI